MKFTINLECTPEEARAFCGLPDVAPMQAQVMKDIEGKMRDNIQTLDPESFFKTWMPVTIQSWQDLQNVFWNQSGAKPDARGGGEGSSRKGKG